MTESLLKADLATISIVFLQKSISTLIWTLLWIPVSIYRSLIIILAKHQPSFGNILTVFQSTVEENYCDENPKTTLMFSFVLDRPISLEKLRQLFTDNVLNAKLSNKKSGQDELRYPEFKQYNETFCGYTFWKKDEHFDISNHIIEQRFSNSSLAKLHQELMNKKYFKKRSAWEMILVPNYQNDPEKSLVLYRFHHTLGDIKSHLKVVVECLGQKALKMPNVEYKSGGLMNQFKFYLLMPFYSIYVQVVSHFFALEANNCAWKWTGKKEPLVNIGISNKININDIKSIARLNGVTGSAVIMAAVTGGAAKCDKRLTKDIPTKYVLPKPGHPDILAVHTYSAYVFLPLTVTSPLKRMQMCNDIFLKWRTCSLHKYEKSLVFQLAMWFNPLRANYLQGRACPLIITNIAGDAEGFEVGESPCSEFNLTCGPVRATNDVVVTLFSYKDSIKVSTTVLDGILDQTQSQKLADLIADEFQILKKATEEGDRKVIERTCGSS